MPDQDAPDVIVVGGGVIGLAVAWEAATAGMAVTLIDPRPGRGAGWAAAGMLAPVGEAHFGEEALTALNVAAARSWPAFARALEEASGLPVHYLACGTLMIALDGSDRAATDDLLAYHQSLGLTARRLTATECRGSEPLLAPGDPRRSRPGRGPPGRQPPRPRRAGGRLPGRRGHRHRGGGRRRRDAAAAEPAGVVVRHVGFRAAGTVVVAAGCRSGLLAGIPDRLLPPVRPVKGLTLRLRAPSGVPGLARTVRGLIHGRNCYLVPRVDGSVVVGATVEEKGFDLAVQAGAVGDLLDDARRLVPVLEEYELVDTTTGLRPGSPDNAPMVGATEVRGLVVATGHYRNGFLLAPLTAREVVGVIAGRTSAPCGASGPFAPFGPARFAAEPDRREAGPAGERSRSEISG